MTKTAAKLAPTAAQKKTVAAMALLTPEKRRRVFTLLDLSQKSTDKQERAEIMAVVTEIMFRNPADLEAIPSEDLAAESDAASREAVQKHRDHIAKRVRELRQAKEWSQQSLADKAGLPQSHVARIETGKHSSTYLTIKKLAKALRVTPGDIDPSNE